MSWRMRNRSIEQAIASERTNQSERRHQGDVCVLRPHPWALDVTRNVGAVTRHGSCFLLGSRYAVCEHSLTSPEGSGRGENPGNSTNNGPVARARARVGGSFNGYPRTRRI